MKDRTTAFDRKGYTFSTKDNDSDFVFYVLFFNFRFL